MSGSNHPQYAAVIIRIGSVLALFLLLAGLTAPLMTLTRFWVLDRSFSMLAGIAELFANGQLLLALLVILFSILLPLAKLWLIFTLAPIQTLESPHQRRLLSWMHEYGRWAMLDVLVVAVLIVAVKLGAIAEVEIHWGLYLFAAAVLLIMVLTQLVARRINLKTDL